MKGAAKECICIYFLKGKTEAIADDNDIPKQGVVDSLKPSQSPDSEGVCVLTGTPMW